MDSQLPNLISAQSTLRLEQIASLRARGVGSHIDLPQLVVCGDQSAGKSSVLEAISGLPFPRQDGLCTKFPTEIILQHTDDEVPRISACIIPSASREESVLMGLRAFQYQLKSFEELPDVVNRAGALMGISGYGSNGIGPSFGDDVLRIEYRGRCGMQLTIVDLPGLIAVEGEDQLEDDIQVVQDLVESYIRNPRTIILAVIQAGNDISNQKIIRWSRKVDPSGQRTVGIITKPDLINEGAEKRIALLARNEDTIKLNLGFFLLKNPSPSELASGITFEQRQAKEAMFFRSSPWKEQRLRDDYVGALSLRAHLQRILDQHIERELPKVREEVKDLMRKTEAELAALGEERTSVGHMRLYLSRLAMKLHTLSASALNGTYQESDSVFFAQTNEGGSSFRLRAAIHRLNTSFSDRMRDHGEKRKITIKAMPVEWPSDETAIDSSDDESINENNGQILVSECQMRKWVKSVYLESRGKELPGNYNHVLLTELFHIQSSRWISIAEEHVEKVCQEVIGYINGAMKYLITDERVLTELHDIVDQGLQQSKHLAMEELRRLWDDEKTQQPITYNHYYTDNVQKSRQTSARRELGSAVQEAIQKDWNGKFHFSNNSQDEIKLLDSLQRRIIVNMEEQACNEALIGLRAYYKVNSKTVNDDPAKYFQVAEKTFVDNICRQVIERHVVQPLPNLFNPERVAFLSDDELQRIAAESPSLKARRQELFDLHINLDASLRDLRRTQ